MLKRLIKRLKYNFYHSELLYWNDMLDDLILEYEGHTLEATVARAKIDYYHKKLKELY